MMLIKAFQGFCMALADSVPGVSGGTVAFILGFYEQFLEALHDLFGRDRTSRAAALRYLMKLGLGWCIGMGASALALSRMFEQNIYFLSSLFLGLTVASFPFVVREEWPAIRGKWRDFPFLLLGAAVVCAMAFSRSQAAGSAAVDYLALRPEQYPYLFFSGAVAIMAMVLPGVSGSTLLLILGVYVPTISAIHAFLTLEWAVVPGLLALGLGILAGIALSIGLLRAALRKYRSPMLYLILGLMLGSLAAIAMGPTTLASPQPALSLETFDLLGLLLGIVILLGLEGLKSVIAKQEAAEKDSRLQVRTPEEAGCRERSQHFG